jgi:hypothetical protein
MGKGCMAPVPGPVAKTGLLVEEAVGLEVKIRV